MVAQYKEGKEAVLQALVGMVMKATKGSANPAVSAKLLKEMM
jgi:Asp-tRNA(Asn)/Glu-tRNA(Gln) amidotransferase B subunit